MGDIVDGRGNLMPTPGTGRAKRARIDGQGNFVSDGDVQWYSSTGQKFSLNQQLSNFEVVSADGALSVTVPVSILNARSATVQTTLAAGTYVGQRKYIVCTNATSACDVDANFLGATATITFGAGESVTLMWVDDSDSGNANTPGWAIIGTSTLETGGAITNGALVPRSS